MDSILEVQRQTHEEIEHFERALYTVLSKPQPTPESRLQTEHKASQLLDRISSRVVTLSNQYEDQNTRKSELDKLSAPGGPNDLAEFYVRLGKIQEHYVKYPETIANGFELELAALIDMDADEPGEDEYEQDDRKWTRNCRGLPSLLALAIALLFSGEEQYGKYLDLYANHTAYNNLKHIGKRLGYLQYLDVLLAAQSTTVHSELPKECRITRDYELYVFWNSTHRITQQTHYLRYIKALHTYLLSFTKRAQPLVDIESQQHEAEAIFSKQWDDGLIEGWEDAVPKTTGEGPGIWCSACQFLQTIRYL